MQNKRIIYQNDEGNVAVIIPADCGLTIRSDLSSDRRRSQTAPAVALRNTDHFRDSDSNSSGYVEWDLERRYPTTDSPYPSA